MRRALTGIQPSGTLHIGNYLGSIRPALDLQLEFAPYYFVADYHALTSIQDPETLKQATREIAASFLALGLDTKRTVLFRQSAVPEVCELAWILACQVPPGVLDRGHAVKAAIDGKREINAGIMFYPILMAADILMYGTHLVPVGRDQKQHVEIARDIALKVNYRFGDDTLVVPEVMIREEVGVVPGTDGRKMSKSYGNILPLWAPAKKMRKAVMRIVTDSKGLDDSKDPDECNVFNLFKLFATTEQVEEMRGNYQRGGFGYGHAKQALFESIEATLAEPREKYFEYMRDPKSLDDVLAHGANRAREAASVTIDRLRQRVGLT
ncbi:MAG: tryptophan--tRNA ligase [Proteobacteria bacterium]|nr:tryptophan--tRNA ligase [Pseudomonadota bacterium]